MVPDNTWLELTWEPSDSEGDSPITDYVVQVRRIDEPWTHPLQHHVLEASARSHAVPGLDNGVRYAVRVAALNETGAGAWAEAEATPAVAPGVLDPPVQVLASASETAMTVTWRLPAGVDRVNVDDFWLEWKAASEPWALLLGSISLADTRMMWHQDLGLGIGRITGLSQGQRYTVRVAASDGSGTGRWAAEIDVAAAGRPSAVTDLAYTWRDQDLVLWWDQPENDGGSPILNFNLLWTCPLTNCGRNTETVEGTSHVLAAAQLESALHVIGVAAVNQEGESDYESIWVNVRDTPTAPQSLSVEVSGDSVEAVWEHPEADGLAPISEYQLEWKLRSQQWDVAQQEVVDPESTSHAIDSGIEAGMYEFRVTAINRFGAGDASSVVQLTIAEPPGQPTNLVLEADDGRLIAEWAPATAGSLDVVHFVQWKPASQAGWTGASEAEVAVGSAVHTIEGLSNGVSHTVRVRGRSVAGHGPWSSEESGAAAAPAAGDPGDLALEGRHERIVVTWSPPQSPASPVDKYVFQWRLSGESYDTTRQTEVGPNTRKGTVYNLDNNVVYLVRLSAVDADGEVLGTTEASARVVPAREYIERRIVERYEGDYPWIRQTWNVPLNVNVGKATGVYLFITGRAKSESGTVWPSVARGIGYGFTPFSYSSHVTAVHELAHHFTLDVRVADHPAPVAVGWLYVKQLLGGKCKVSEIYPDFLVYVTTNTKQKLGYLKSCSVTSNPPRQEVQDVARSIAQGEMPQWFFDTYTSDGTYATADLDRLWSDIKSTTQKNANGFRFRNMFGGYCSEREAIIALRSSGGPAYKNPWVDGGCETRWPLDLSASAGSSGSIDVSWQEPHYATTPAIDAYLVQWKAAGEQYDSTRQALVTDLTDLSHTITGLTSGAQYSVRLAAVNEDDASDFVDDDGHTRAAETQATAG